MLPGQLQQAASVGAVGGAQDENPVALGSHFGQGILAGAVLAFARALGEYGATSMLIGYTPGRTATISTTVYQLWRTNDEAGAMLWVLVNLAISAVVLLVVNLLEDRQKKAVKR